MPPAQQKNVAEEFFRDSNGVQIFFRSHRPADKPRAVIVICHGVNSHGGQYVWSAEKFVERGFAVYTIDLRGRGRSEGRRFHIDDVSEYVTGLKQLIAIAKSREPGLPVYLLGHSAGGVVSTTYVLDNQKEIDGFICESFAFRVPAPKPLLAIIRGLNHIVPKLPVLKLKNEDFSRDPQMVATLNADPLTKNEVQPVATVAALLRANDRMEREFGRITLPLFIMHGTSDKATVPAGSVLFHEKAGSADKTLKLYEGHFHDLLADTEREGVIDDIAGWIDTRIK